MKMNEKLALFEMATTVEYERGLSHSELLLLKRIFVESPVVEKKFLRDSNWMPVARIEELLKEEDTDE